MNHFGRPALARPATARAGRIALETRFGTFACEPAECFHLASGLIGFPELRDVALTRLPGHRFAGLWLMLSVEDAALAFVVQPYRSELGLLAAEDLAAAIGRHRIAPENAQVLLIANPQRRGERMEVHVNLRAPLILDSARRLGWQHVLPSEDYEIRRELLAA